MGSVRRRWLRLSWGRRTAVRKRWWHRGGGRGSFARLTISKICSGGLVKTGASEGSFLHILAAISLAELLLRTNPETAQCIMPCLPSSPSERNPEDLRQSRLELEGSEGSLGAEGGGWAEEELAVAAAAAAVRVQAETGEAGTVEPEEAVAELDDGNALDNLPSLHPWVLKRRNTTANNQMADESARHRLAACAVAATAVAAAAVTAAAVAAAGRAVTTAAAGTAAVAAALPLLLVVLLFHRVITIFQAVVKISQGNWHNASRCVHIRQVR
ncbi:hypothetical protein MLD38_036779 [Melastoma candidum]|uniref:Uncharacterized protein n=1 Tax=Melastoma candidum TaxID=119954 RepID=A0ACB9LML0_9MYRT|nr:hypothetical protein MLD38_036779 [Melastoma candidum]